jgi:NifU-like protein involved in Fe-S cluster formation
MNPELEELYQEVILDHSRRPRNFGELADATCVSTATIHRAAMRSISA